MSLKFISPDYKISNYKSVLERSEKYKGTEKYLVYMQLPRHSYRLVTFSFNSIVSNPTENKHKWVYRNIFCMYEISGKYRLNYYLYCSLIFDSFVLLFSLSLDSFTPLEQCC